MASVAKFDQEEMAALCAGRLKEEGIEARVVQHSSFDASLLGVTQPFAIHVEVSDEDLERAMAVLNEKEKGSQGFANSPEIEQIPDEPSNESARQTLRKLVTLDICLYAAGFPISMMRADSEPDYVVDYLIDQVWFDSLWSQAYQFSIPFYATVILADVLLFFSIRSGRWLYVLTCIWAILLLIAYPPQIAYPLESVLASIQWILVGVILRTIFTKPVASLFVK